MPELSYREAVRDALSQAMRKDDDVFIMGEDIAEMGGSMGVTQGMLDEFGPERVRNTPISEMALVGAGIGAAMQGMRPVVEVMYEDFLTLAAEQVVNQAAKHRYMSGGQLKVPLTIRTQGGAGWSPGAQHAQQLEAWFVHIPGLKVLFPSTATDVRGLLWSAIYDDNPVVFFEHRTLYGLKEDVPEELEPIPIGQARVHREGEDVTVVATGRLVHESLAAAEEAEKEGVSVEVVDPRTLQPLDEQTIVDSVKKTNRCRRRARGRDEDGLRRRGGRGRPAPGFRLARRAGRARRREVRAAPVRAGDGGVRRPAPGRGLRGDHANGWHEMAVDVSLPRLGQGMEAGTIVRWLKSEGDQVEKGEPLYELDTDKVTQEVEAEASGVLLKILAGEGEEIEVGKRIAVIGEQGEDVAAEAEAEVEVEEDEQEEGSPGEAREEERERGREAAAEEEEPAAEAQPSRVDGRVKASPLARRIARERGIELTNLTGTGPEGRIVAEDVERAAATPAHATVGAAPLEAEVVPLTSIRRTIARRLTKAWEAPAFQISMSADMTRAQALRERLRDQKVTVTDVLTKLSAIALLRHRELNAQFADDELRIFPSANIGLAVATERGLVVPVIREVERKSLVQLAVERGQLVERARDGQADPGRPRGRHVHDLEPRHVRRRDLHGRPQSAAGCDPRSRRDRGEAGRRGGRARRPPDDGDDPHVRPPRRGRLERVGVPPRAEAAARGARDSRCDSFFGEAKK